MKKISGSIGAWLRGMVWTAMILGCAWAGAQNYVIAQPAHYRLVSMGSGAVAPAPAEDAAVPAEPAAEGAQNSEPLPKDDLFAGTEVFAKGASDITEVTMDPDTLNLVGGSDEHKAHSMVLNVVRTYTYDRPGMYNMADVDAIRNKLNTGDWHCSVHIRDLKNGSGSDVCAKHRTDGMSERAIIEVQPKSLTFVHTIRKGGAGSSDLGFFPMMPGLGPMAMIAMTNPEALADMQIGMGAFPMMLNVQPNVMMELRDMSIRPFDGEQMKGFADSFKALKIKPMDEKQMKDLSKQMEKMKQDFPRMAPMAPESPETPETPQVAPTPEAPVTPQTPQVAPTPETPVTPQSPEPAVAPQPHSI